MASMNLGRGLVIFCCLITAFVAQTAVLSRLGLPGATPDLLLVVVLIIAFAAGPVPGTIVGFAAGLLVDVAPPASGSVGQTAAIYAAAAFLAGNIQLAAVGEFDVWTVVALAGLASAVVVVQLAAGALLGSIAVTWTLVPLIVVTQFVYCAALCAALLVPIGALYRGAGDEGRFA